MDIKAIVLTHNEERHIGRCLSALEDVASSVLVVDSLSTDRTVEIARQHGAEVLSNPWTNYATQFNWALSQVEEFQGWILRIDADEYPDATLKAALRELVEQPDPPREGYYFSRRIVFQGTSVRFGGVGRQQTLRLFRRASGRCEQRWMDEHIRVQGSLAQLAGFLIDDNRQSLGFWIAKHNRYADREAVDLLNLRYGFMPEDSTGQGQLDGGATLRRWLKIHVYARLPSGFRALLYFLYRYFLRLGFLDRFEGANFHLLQGFWYRYLVDAKYREVERYIRQEQCDARHAIREVLAIDTDNALPPS